MAAKQNSSTNKKHVERTSITQQAESLLKDIKEKNGDVIQVQITNRTSIELPAHLSHEERMARVANYLNLHKSNI